MSTSSSRASSLLSKAEQQIRSIVSLIQLQRDFYDWLMKSPLPIGQSESAPSSESPIAPRLPSKRLSDSAISLCLSVTPETDSLPLTVSLEIAQTVSGRSLGLRYDMPMKSKPLTPFENFTQAMDGLMRVPHSEIKRALAREKRANTGKPKRGPKPKHSSASGRVSGDGD
ncbi:MAG: hypothetical protein WA254_10265 [Candidatus Sulfotelmatobacter sp.]